MSSKGSAVTLALLAMTREERPWRAGGGIADQAIHDPCPRLRGLAQVYLGVVVTEAVLAEHDGCARRCGMQFIFPGRGASVNDAGGGVHADEPFRLRGDVRLDGRFPREAKPC